MPTITLRPRNPLDPTPDELEDLARAIQHLYSDYEVIVTTGERPRVGVSLWEVIECYVPWSDMTSAAAGALIAELHRWLRNRFEKVPGRPKSMVIYGPDGKVLKEIEMQSPEEGSRDR